MKIKKMKDKFKNYKLKIPVLYDMPFRMLIVGKSELSGKSNFIGNILLNKDLPYHDKFEGENIYIICPSSNLDYKWQVMIQEKDIPSENIINEYDESLLEQLYKLFEEDFIEHINNREKPPHRLLIFDDMSFGGNLKNKSNGVISKLFCNGRHLLISTILTSQKYTDILTTCRENATACILFSCTDKQLDLITDEHNFIDKKKFKKMFRKNTNEPHTFLSINYSKAFKDRYQDYNFNSIDINNY